MSEPESGYAESAGESVGYQVVGTGAAGCAGRHAARLSLDLMWDEPRLVRFLNGLSSFSRHIWFDAGGTGSSGSLEPVEGRLLTSVVDDMVAVLDECGCERAVVFGSGAGLPALQFAATHPERTIALVLIDPSARMRRADDYSEGLPNDDVEAALACPEIGGERVHSSVPSLRAWPTTPGSRAGSRAAKRLSTTPQDALWRFVPSSRSICVISLGRFGCRPW